MPAGPGIARPRPLRSWALPAPAGARRRRGRCRNVGLGARHDGKAALLDDGGALPSAGLGKLGHLGRAVALGAEASAQNGASATTVAACAATPASLRAVEPVTQPPQVKPRMAQAAAPIRHPRSSVWCLWVGSWQIPSAAERRSRRRAQDRVAGNQQDQENREQDGRYEPSLIVHLRLGGSARISQPSQAEAWWAMVRTVVHLAAGRVQAIRPIGAGCSIRDTGCGRDVV